MFWEGKIFKLLLLSNEMEKDYRIWTPIKTNTNNNGSHPRGYKEREIWICKVGENIGFEEDGKIDKNFVRPVLILKIFSKEFCHIIPLSKTEKRGKYYYAFDGNTGTMSVALLSQSKAIDSSRLVRKIGIAKKEDFIKIKDELKEVINL
jgi:mRNA-degrading endonuclease toxin of MazEF toxin-antitoxin module